MSVPISVGLFTECCVLCRGVLETRADVRAISLWDVYPHRRLSYHQSKHWANIYSTLNPVLEKGIAGVPATLIRWKSNGPGPMIYFAHVDCWRVANRAYDTRALLAFARNTRPLIPRRWAGLGDIESTPWRVSEQDLDRSTPLGGLLAQVARLPPELQARIVAGLRQDRAACMVRTLQTAASIPGTTAGCSPPSRELRICPSPASRIYASTSVMFGRAYLRDLHFDGAAGANTSVYVEAKDVRGIRFAIAAHGLRGIRVLYRDATESEWLGSHQDCLFGETYGDDLSRLWMTRDDLRLIRVEFDCCGAEEAATSKQYRALWNHEMPLAQGLENVALPSPWPNSRHPSTVIRHYPSWRVCEFLPLALVGSSASGISVSIDRRYRMLAASVYGVKGPNGCVRAWASMAHISSPTVHLALRGGEYIVGAWARRAFSTAEPPDEHQCLVVATNLGRSHVFGDYIAPNPGEDEHFVSWAPLTPRASSRIAGLFISSETQSFGASYHPGRTQPTPEWPCLPRANTSWQGVLAIASLRNVKTIQLQQCARGSFLDGLRLDYHDGGVSVLGRWDPYEGAVVSTLYDTSWEGKPLRGLGFRFSRDGSRSFRTDRILEAVLLTGERPQLGGEGRQWRLFYASECEAIAWWWAQNGRYNAVEEWKGSTEVPREVERAETIQLR